MKDYDFIPVKFYNLWCFDWNVMIQIWFHIIKNCQLVEHGQKCLELPVLMITIINVKLLFILNYRAGFMCNVGGANA